MRVVQQRWVEDFPAEFPIWAYLNSQILVRLYVYMYVCIDVEHGVCMYVCMYVYLCILQACKKCMCI